MNIKDIKTPAYIIDKAKLVSNLRILSELEKRTGCRILLAQKAFSAFALYPLIGEYISGTAASGLFEARLGHEEMGKENHVFSPAYRQEEMDELVGICDHIVFNSFSQFNRFADLIKKAENVSAGIRINPRHSTQGGGIYDPCASGSRLGVASGGFPDRLPDGIEGFHFHTLCEQNSDALAETFEVVERDFGRYFGSLKWINLGGGHHITREDYDISTLENIIERIINKYGLTVYLEPGEAVALNAGYLVTEVMDKVENGIEILILDASAACHMPDVLEMPYRPPLYGAGKAGEKQYTYRLSSRTCLAGDIIGDYSFNSPVSIGNRLIFEDMAIYTMVKNNTFNGMPLPDIALLEEDGSIRLIKSFGYKDFKGRLS